MDRLSHFIGGFQGSHNKRHKQSDHVAVKPTRPLSLADILKYRENKRNETQAQGHAERNLVLRNPGWCESQPGQNTVNHFAGPGRRGDHGRRKDKDREAEYHE